MEYRYQTVKSEQPMSKKGDIKTRTWASILGYLRYSGTFLYDDQFIIQISSVLPQKSLIGGQS